MSTLIIRGLTVNFSRLGAVSNSGYGNELSAFFTGASDEDQIKMAQYKIFPTAYQELSGFNFRRYVNTARGIPKKPLIVMDKEFNPMYDKAIGNGSVVDLKLDVYPSDYAEGGYGYQLAAIVVRELNDVPSIVDQSPELWHKEDF
jgi:hypothetical protein